MRRLSIRWRLTLWYGAVLLVMLIGFSGAVYLLMQRHLLTLNDSALREELDELTDEVGRVEALSSLPDVLRLRFPGHEGYELQVGTIAGKCLFRTAITDGPVSVTRKTCGHLKSRLRMTQVVCLPSRANACTSVVHTSLRSG